jgi:hypothetical protein
MRATAMRKSISYFYTYLNSGARELETRCFSLLAQADLFGSSSVRSWHVVCNCKSYSGDVYVYQRYEHDDNVGLQGGAGLHALAIPRPRDREIFVLRISLSGVVIYFGTYAATTYDLPQVVRYVISAGCVSWNSKCSFAKMYSQQTAAHLQQVIPCCQVIVFRIVLSPSADTCGYGNSEVHVKH